MSILDEDLIVNWFLLGRMEGREDSWGHIVLIQQFVPSNVLQYVLTSSTFNGSLMVEI